ncbi:MAG: hypothetical protein GY795_20975 [Desulfobacterales bacterium]|nr:hypothetical protein [Desulfobacterales bacterium]
MRTFVYGRKDVLKGMREYGVFLKSPDFPYELGEEIEKLFSTEDFLDPSILQRVGEFILYFPLPDRNIWVMGKGKIEERGKYYSYILHGVLLDKQERENMHYNPFAFLNLNPDIGDNREYLPDLKPYQKIGAEDYCRGISEIFSNSSPRLFNIIGKTAATLTENFRNIVIPYHNNLNENIWTLIFFLIPTSIREKTSLCSFSQFIAERYNQNLTIRGIIHKEDILDILPNELYKTPVGDFLFRLLRDDEDRMELLIYFYHAVDSILQHRRPSEALKNIIKAVDRYSISSLEHWPEIPDKQFVESKIKHFQNVCHRYNGDLNVSDIRKRLTRHGINLSQEMNRIPGLDGGSSNNLANLFSGNPEMLKEFKAEELIEMADSRRSDNMAQFADFILNQAGENKHDEIIRMLVDKILRERGNLAEFIDNIICQNHGYMQALLYRLYLRTAFLYKNDSISEKNEIMQAIHKCYEIDKDCHTDFFYNKIQSRFMGFALHVIATADEKIIKIHREILMNLIQHPEGIDKIIFEIRLGFLDDSRQIRFNSRKIG